MRRTHYFLLTLATGLFTIGGFAQNVAINEDGSAPDTNAILDVKSFTKGVLIPRVSTAGRLAIPNTKGLMVYDTTTSLFWYNTGTAWQSLSQGATGWLLNGNGGTDAGNFLGTTDSRPLLVKVNNQLSGWLDTISKNTFWGYTAGNLSPRDSLSNISFNFNTGIGYRSMFGATSGNRNTAVGYLTLFAGTTKSVDNTAIGYSALSSNLGLFNTAVGSSSMILNTSGNSNTAIGKESLSSNTTGSSNTASGSGALLRNTTGSNNVAYGASTMINNSTGSSNTAIGEQSFVNNTTGSENTVIGVLSDVALFSGNLTNATAIGARAVVNASNKVRIGNSAVTVIEGQVPFTTPSDGRYKHHVQEDVKGLDFIMQLRPVTYQFDVKRFDDQQGNNSGHQQASPVSYTMQASYNEAAAIRRSGFIAQEVEKAADASGYNFSGIIKPKTEREHYSLSYESFVVPLVKGMQEQQRIIDAQNKKIEQQDKQLSELRQELDEVKQLLQRSK